MDSDNKSDTKNQQARMHLILPHNREDWENIRHLLENTSVNTGSDLDNLIASFRKIHIEFFKVMFGENNVFDNNGEVIAVTDLYQTLKTLILELPTLFPNYQFPLLPNEPGSITLNRRQVAALLASSFMGLFSEKYYPSGSRFPVFDICRLFSFASIFGFALCIVHYFHRIREKTPDGNLIITRKVLEQVVNFPKSTKKICKIELSNNLIERVYDKKYHADFANQYIGGGVLGGGCVQEEILFVIKPECLVSLLYCAVMLSHEAIIISGAEQFSDYSGYAHSFAFNGNFENTTPFNTTLNCIDNHIVAIDALVARGGDFEFRQKSVHRDIVKAYIGICNPEKFSSDPEHWFVTGNWGCGAFGGNVELKACQQIVAASEAGVHLVYCTFGKKHFHEQLQEFIKFLEEHNVTTGELATVLYSINEMLQDTQERSVFQFVKSRISANRKSEIVQQTVQFTNQIVQQAVQLTNQIVQQVVQSEIVQQALQPETVQQAVQPETVQQAVQPETVQQAVQPETVQQAVQPEAVQPETVQLTNQIVQQVVQQAVQLTNQIVQQAVQLTNQIVQVVQPEIVQQAVQPETEQLTNQIVQQAVQPETVQQADQPEAVQQADQPETVQQADQQLEQGKPVPMELDEPNSKN